MCYKKGASYSWALKAERIPSASKSRKSGEIPSHLYTASSFKIYTYVFSLCSGCVMKYGLEEVVIIRLKCSHDI